MNDNSDLNVAAALCGRYIIDGTPCDLTPEQLLSECTDGEIAHAANAPAVTIVDETIEPGPTSFTYDRNALDKYLNLTMSFEGKRDFRMLYPEVYTKQMLVNCLSEALWREGQFTLQCLRLKAAWNWKGGPVGNMAAFYNSVKAVSEYLSPTGVRISAPEFSINASPDGSEDGKQAQVSFSIDKVTFPQECIDEDSASEPILGPARACPDTILPERDSWIIYIPFDTCSPRMGGSLLAQMMGHNGGLGPDICDSDYFMDCFEVVRELVEDGVVLSGMTVGDGGLATAMGHFCGSYGAYMDISSIKEALGEGDSIKVAFCETPGVIIQIDDDEFDYLDSQMLLQDVAYYPIGHPTGDGKLRISGTPKGGGLHGLLDALMSSAPEGED